VGLQSCALGHRMLTCRLGITGVEGASRRSQMEDGVHQSCICRNRSQDKTDATR